MLGLKGLDRRAAPAPASPTSILAQSPPLAHGKGSRWIESAVELRAFAVAEDGPASELAPVVTARLVRALTTATRIKDPRDLATRRDLVDIQAEIFGRLRLPSDEEIAEGTRYAVWPLAAVTMVA